MKQPDELSADEAADLLGVEPQTVRLYHRRGLLDGRKDWAGMVPRYYFTRAAVEACARRLAQERAGVSTTD